jgi:hypothetical protein
MEPVLLLRVTPGVLCCVLIAQAQPRLQCITHCVRRRAGRAAGDCIPLEGTAQVTYASSKMLLWWIDLHALAQVHTGTTTDCATLVP